MFTGRHVIHCTRPRPTQTRWLRADLVQNKRWSVTALRQLHQHIRQLPPLDRQIILLYLEEIPQPDIAEISGLSHTNISTRVHRIKTKLARAMEGVRP